MTAIVGFKQVRGLRRHHRTVAYPRELKRVATRVATRGSTRVCAAKVRKRKAVRATLYTITEEWPDLESWRQWAMGKRANGEHSIYQRKNGK